MSGRESILGNLSQMTRIFSLLRRYMHCIHLSSTRLLPDYVHPVWWWSSCRSSFTRLCSPRLTVEFMSLIFYQTLFPLFDGGVHVAHLLADSVHPVWRWSSCRSSFTRLCSPSLTVEFMSLIFSVFCVMCFNIYVFPVFCFVCWLMSFAFPFGRLLGVR